MAEFDRYSEKAADAMALIRKFTGVEYYDVFKGDPEKRLEEFVSIVDQFEGEKALLQDKLSKSERDRQLAEARMFEMSAIAAGTAWQPIETAPKDGLPILVVANEVVQHIVVANFRGLWHCLGDDEGIEDFYPTHWMPLPRPPVESKMDGRNG